MHRFLVPPDRSRGDSFPLGEGESRHAVQVLRLRPGDPVRVLDGAGGVLDAVIESADRREAHVAVQHRTFVSPPRIRIVLLLALLKGRALDFVLEKAVELGVSAIVLVDAARSVARIEAADLSRKQEAWRQTLVEAAKQSGNPWLPTLHGPLPPGDAIQSAGASRLLLASLQPGAEHLGTALGSAPNGGTATETVAIAIGPEGDFTPDEEAVFRAAGAIPVTLGPLVLRAETAALAALAVIGDHARR
jgi:16S rRNA (uracil1498-N3)-methyltransferase